MTCVAVEHVEPVVVAVVQKSVEFALCCLDKSVCDNEDLSLQVCIFFTLKISFSFICECYIMFGNWFSCFVHYGEDFKYLK